MTEKKTLRKEIRACTEPVNLFMQSSFDKDVQSQIKDLIVSAELADASFIASYNPAATELDPKIIQDQTSHKGQFVFPRVTNFKKREMDFCYMNSTENFRAGIIQPSKEEKNVNFEKIKVFIIPCLAADLTGNRLGSGYGFYDRFFSKLESSNYMTIGIVQSRNLKTKIPRDPYDLKLDYIATELNLIKTTET